MPRTSRTTTRWAVSAVSALGAMAALATTVATPASATASTTAGITTSATAAEAAPRAGHYVALGDSFTAGPGIPRQTDARCGRSSANYPSLVRADLGITSFTDASCDGASTVHMEQRQRETGKAPQLDALHRNTRLVTLGIGGNDIGLGEVFARCFRPAGGEVPRDNPCQRSYHRNGTDELDRRIEAAAPQVAAVLKAVHERAPRARVAVVGYPALIGDDVEGCRASLRIADGDIPYVRGTLRRLNAMLRREATAQGHLYVNTHATTAGHDACRPFADRYVEGLTTRPRTRPAAPLHPNAAGERAMAKAVADALVFGPAR
ncbi:SGNH/GDSL hydrolase family protein [Streptomyces cinnamoneus]|uniref:Lipase n=1 Tax=Streptomyces cinnamoneus TaxID=53446 RepID=A0A918TA23_STRCJ|nr:SGNH/GDSL hydrolase family protein [Streptomyces cinnamoneus]GHC36066.1 lipase [Streptomyces cinnamoneus]